MMASVGETDAKLVVAAAMPSSPSPVKAPTRAVPTGSPAAATLPKPITSTTSATAMPISSERASLSLGLSAWPSRPP